MRYKNGYMGKFFYIGKNDKWKYYIQLDSLNVDDAEIVCTNGNVKDSLYFVDYARNLEEFIKKHKLKKGRRI